MSLSVVNPMLPSVSHRRCIREKFKQCLESLPNAICTSESYNCICAEGELAANQCAVNVVFADETRSQEKDALKPTPSKVMQPGVGCSSGCIGQHTRTAFIDIEVYAQDCNGALNTLDKCICNIESLITQHQCDIGVPRIEYLNTSRVEFNRGTAQQLLLQIITYEIEYNFDPGTCKIQVKRVPSRMHAGSRNANR